MQDINFAKEKKCKKHINIGGFFLTERIANPTGTITKTNTNEINEHVR